MHKKLRKTSVPLRGEIFVDPDKSISHRAVIFSALAKGEGIIKNFLLAADTLSSCNCIEQLGVHVEREGSLVKVSGNGLYGLKEPLTVLQCGNSGTTMRLLTGVLASQPFFSVLSGDNSLNRRPMRRVLAPLGAMGAEIRGRDNGNYPPLAVKGGKLKGINYQLPVASAQVKTAILLASLDADSETVIIEPEKSRDHTERMLSVMGADLEVADLQVILRPGKELIAQEFVVPGDISSAAFFIVAASIIAGSELLIRDVGINSTRTGIIKVLQSMGGKIKLENRREIAGEMIADILVSSSDLKGIEIRGDIIPQLIDELPVLAVAMAVAEGESIVRDAAELRVKETDRIAAVCLELSKMGVEITELEDGFIVKGNPGCLRGGRVGSWGDHRIAMSLAIAGIAAEGETDIANAETVDISFPNFWKVLSGLTESDL
ncbi:MAG: 3-phosphoshikimate 1-carboxyvinyltransferase [Syntrophomonadaceae bacterium]|nr:3-phosphoshikimate 1-carboxyvinyltransferase [Syntrophomonadaceae bacterium]